MKFDIDVVKTYRYCYINARYNGERIGKLCVDLDSEDVTRYTKVHKGKFAKIILVSTSEKFVGRGVATALMNKAIETLKDYNLYLNVISLKRNDNDKDKHQLMEFYKKFGFKQYDDDICTTTMIRTIDLQYVT